VTTHRIATIGALLVVFSTSAFAQPGAATLISPSSDVNNTTIAFTWQSAPTATWYHFWLGRADTSLITEHWYTAEHAGCASGGTCAITVTPPVTAGAYIWHIRTWSSAGYGPWSAPHMFSVRDVVQAWSGTLPPSRRFTIVFNGEGVLDNETGLVWQRVVSSNLFQWVNASFACGNLSTAGRLGWRVPTMSELASLVDTLVLNPSLPPGHPFTVPATLSVWSYTPSAAGAHYGVNFNVGGLFQASDSGELRIWCVRGGASPAS
jgi:hypothetical protein